VGSLRSRPKATLCLLLAGPLIWAQSPSLPLPYWPAYRHTALEALHAFYNVEFHRGFALLDSLERRFGPYAGTAYLRALGYSWQIELDPATTWFDTPWEKAIARTDSLLRCCNPEPLETYFIGFANRALYVRRLYIRGHLLRSVWEARSLISLLSGIRQYAPTYPEMQFELGLYEYYIAYFSANYPIMRPILSVFPPGNKERGLSRLSQCARDSLNYTQTEAAYFLGYIYLYQEKKPDSALYWLAYLVQRYPQNSLFRRMKAEALCEKGRYAEARSTIASWLDAYEKNCFRPPCYLFFSPYPTAEAVQAYGLMGLCYREEGNYEAAGKAFERMDSLLKSLRLFPAPTWGRLQREVAIYYKRIGRSDLAEERLRQIAARDDVPGYLKKPLP
jgi:tetratricopeptide (TPR) repeat protein